MKKTVLFSALAFGLLFSAESFAQDPTVKQDNKVVNPEKKDEEKNKEKNTTDRGTSEKMSIGEEGDSNDTKKKSTTSDGKSSKNPVVTPNTTRNPKKN
ncbi:MAG: hypothetical protein IT233_03295 [Bacteroidia bacterium]|nr:hypothetical protein [Bacteroidia bacterium]